MGKASGFKSLKLLAFGLLVQLTASLWMGHECLAQSLPTSYTFSIEDIGPFRGHFITSRPEWKLSLVHGIWDLEVKDEKSKRVTTMALEDFRSSRYRSGAINQMLLADWILAFDPNQIIDAKGAKIIQPRKFTAHEFLKSWNAYLLRFQEEWSAQKDELRRQGYTTSAELYFSKALVQRGIVSALEDPQVLKRLQDMAGKVLSENLSAFEFKLDDSFEASFQGRPYQTRLVGSLLIKPLLRAEDFEVSFDPQSAGKDDQFRTSMGKITFVLPLTEASIDVKSFEVHSEFTQKPYVIGAGDEMSMKVEFNKAKPFKLTADIFWDKLLQRPDIRFPVEELEAPFKTARLTKINLRGQSYEPSQGSVIEWMMNNEGWKVLQGAVESGGFVQNLIAVSTEQLSALLQKNLPFRETFAIIQSNDPQAKEKFKLDVFKPGLAAHDPGLNPNLVARFQLTIPIEIKTPEMNLNVRPTQEALAGQISIQILNPDVELEHLELFWKGQRLSSNRAGFRFRMINRVGSYTKLDANADLSLSKSLDFKLDKLSTNLEGLSIQALEVRLGERWLNGNRPSLQMIVDNVALIRKELVSSLGQKGLGGKLQAFVENEIRSVMGDRLKNLTIDIPFQGDRLDHDQEVSWSTDALGGFGFVENAKLGLKGRLKLPYIPVQEATFRLQDLKAQGPVCKGTYLISAESKIGITDSIPVVGENWDMAVDIRGWKSNIKVQTLTANLIPEQNARMVFVFDVCLSANRENVDIKIRDVRPSISKMRLAAVQVMGIEVLNENFEKIAKLLGWERGAERDVAISKLVEGILIAQRSEIDRALAQLQAPWFAEQITGFLNSAPIRGQLERTLIQVGDFEEKALELMMDLGKSLKVPLEAMIIQNLTRIVFEHMPKVEQMVTTSRKTMDDLILNIGVLAGEDLEAVFRSQVLKFVYGETSLRYIQSEVRRSLQPSGALKTLRSKLGLRVDPFDDLRWYARDAALAGALMECPFKDPQAAMAKWKKALYEARLEPRQEARLDAFVVATCASGLESKRFVDDLFKEGLLSANSILMDEGVRSYMKLPASDAVPLATGPGEWSREAQLNRARDFEIPVEISKIELLSTGSGELFRVAFSSSAFSNEMGLVTGATVSPFVLETLKVDDQSLIFRLPRPIINQAFLKVDWADLLRQNFPSVFGPYDQIVVERAPFLTENDEIIFKVYARSRSGKIRMLVSPIVKLLGAMFNDKTSDEDLNKLVEAKDQASDMPGINLSDVTAFALSFLDLRNMFGFEATIDGAIKPRFSMSQKQVSVEFDPMRLDQVDAGFLKTPIERRLDAAHRPLNRILGELLSQIGEIPSLTLLASRFSLADVLLVKGDLFAVIRRDDESSIDRTSETR